MTQKIFISSTLILLVLGAILWNQVFQSNPDTETATKKDLEITMYRADGCNCCIKWSDYLITEGFTVNEQLVGNLSEIKSDNNIPSELESCHTATIDGYVVEGHVPAEDIRRLVSEQPDAIGISVPKMPMGSPGMEGPREDPYNVILFGDAGNHTIYAQYP
ncbi:MAG: DUF411 domain-containing protein [Balneolales bacterium]